MPTVSVIYFSGSGHTTKLAEAVQKGAASVAGVQTNLIAISGDDIVKGRYANDEVFAKLDASDAIIFGSPTFMGGPAAQFKAFADATGPKWYAGAWRDKLAAGFTVSSGPSGDKLSTLHYFFTLAMQLGMIWIGFPETPMNDKGIKPFEQLQRRDGAGGTGGDGRCAQRGGQTDRRIARQARGRIRGQIEEVKFG